MICFLRRQQSDVETDEDAVKTVIYNPSTSNQVEKSAQESISLKETRNSF